MRTTARNTAPEPRPELLRIGEAARILGRSTRTLYGWVAAGRLRVYRDPTNGRRYFDLAEVLALAPRLVASDAPVRAPQADHETPLPGEQAAAS